MEATGIVRRVEDLARIVIPKEIGRTLPYFEDPRGRPAYRYEGIEIHDIADWLLQE